jgi:histidinol-phosphate aminotransferase
VHPGEEVIVSKPTFLVYHIASMVEGAEVRVVPMKDFKYDLEGMLEAVTPKTKMIFIANPDNPTGSYVNRDELELFLGSLPEDIVVFIDEAYYEFAKGGDYPETLRLTEREDRNIIVSRTFSKAYSLAGLRVGYAVARRDVAEAVNKVREPFNINSLAQAAALAAIKDKTGHVEKCVKLVWKEKEKFCETFDSIGVRYIPSRTNFILVDTKRDSTKVFQYLLSKGVIVRDMASWGLKGFIRVNMGLPVENIAFLKAFKSAMKEIAK